VKDGRPAGVKDGRPAGVKDGRPAGVKDGRLGGPGMDRLRGLLRPGLEALRAYETPATHAAIRLDANESPWPLPAEARARVQAALETLPLHRYPDPRATELRHALAAHTGTSPERLVLGVGSDEVIQILQTALARPRVGHARAVVMVPDPTFSMYGIIAQGQGLDVVRVPLDAHFQLDVAAFERAIALHRPNLIFLATPNNPTGNAFDVDSLTSIVRAAPDAVVVLDEAYGAFGGRPLAALADANDNVVLLGTLSKIGLASLRVGWARVPSWLALELEKVRLTYNLPLPSQVVATLALGPLWPVFAGHVEAIVAERARFVAALRGIPGVHPLPTDANFVLCEVGERAQALAAALHAGGIQVRAFGAGHPRLAQHLRFTVGTPAEDDALLGALARA
jgi:histidinol-phosphate aminotransferase